MPGCAARQPGKREHGEHPHPSISAWEAVIDAGALEQFQQQWGGLPEARRCRRALP